MLKSEQELPSVSSETFYETHHSVYKSKINEENKFLAAHGNSTLGGFGGKTKTVTNSMVFSPFFNGALPFRASQGMRNKLLGNLTD